MKFWADLYGAQQNARELSSSSWSSELRNRLKALSTKGHCDPSVPNRFTNKTAGHLVEWSIQAKGATVPAALRKIPDLISAELSLMALADRRRNHLHQFAIVVEGKRADGSAWALAVHFEDDRVTKKSAEGDCKGKGACGHAAFHCHVGPGLEAAPKVRVPLPALGPVEALYWVITQLVPGSEPTPWAEVKAVQEKVPG